MTPANGKIRIPPINDTESSFPTAALVPVEDMINQFIPINIIQLPMLAIISAIK
jgi:hypothetical protein